MEAEVTVKNGKAKITLTQEQVTEINRQIDPYIQACIKLGETPRPMPDGEPDSRIVKEWFGHCLDVCVDAKNAIEQPDGSFKLWKQVYDGNEYHWFPRHKPGPSGSGWVCNVYDGWRTYASVGPRREYRSYDLMLEGVKEFAHLYSGCYGN